MKKTALITGSTSGIGLAIAKTFAREGYNIMFHGLEENGEEISKKVGKENNIDTAFSNANLMEPEAIA